MPTRKSDEVKAAQEKVARDREAFRASMEITVKKTVDAVQSKLEEETKQVNELVNSSERKLKEKLTEADRFVEDVGSQFDTALGQARDVAERVRLSADETLQEADQVAIKFENVATELRKDFIQSSDALFGRFERVAQGTRQSLTQATGQIGELMDKAEEAVNRVKDPTKFVSENPRLAISVLLFGGLFLGLFFRRIFMTEGSVRPSMRRIGNAA